MKHHRIISSIVAAVMLVGMLCYMPMTIDAAEEYEEKAYTINGYNVFYTDGSRYGGNCSDYAKYFYGLVWPDCSMDPYFTSPNNSLRELEDSELTLTAEHLKAYVGYAPVGSIIRICKEVNLHSHDGEIDENWPGHSLFIVDKDPNGFTVFEGNVGSGASRIREKHYTWEEFCSSWCGSNGAEYIKYIKWPEAIPYSGAVNLGDSFTAPVINKACGLLLQNSYTEGTKPPARINVENRFANQLWQFTRQADGSYKIASCYDGKYLDIKDASLEIGAAVQTCEDSGMDAQKWFIFKCGEDGYTIRSAMNDYVLDLADSDPVDGTKLQMWEKTEAASQIWSIYQGEECKLAEPVLSVKTGTETISTTLSWNDVYGEKQYTVKLTKDNEPYGGTYILTWNKANAGGIQWDIKLPLGTYEACIEARNAFECKTGNTVTFTVDGSPVVESGTCGDDLTWELTEKGTLTISGNGEIPNFDYDNLPPWGYKYVTCAIIGNNVTGVGKAAFDFNYELNCIHISKTVTNIADGAFDQVPYLHRFDVNSENPCYSSDMSGVLFNKEKTILIQAPRALSGSYTIPDSVTTIHDMAFQWCEGLTEVIMPDGAVTLGRGLFFYCTNLNNVRLPSNLTCLGAGMFSFCFNLEKIAIPESVTDLNSAFTFGGLTSISIPKNVKHIGQEAFWGETCQVLLTDKRVKNSFGMR